MRTWIRELSVTCYIYNILLIIDQTWELPGGRLPVGDLRFERLQKLGFPVWYQVRLISFPSDSRRGLQRTSPFIQM